MENLTIHYKGSFINYSQTTSIKFYPDFLEAYDVSGKILTVRFPDQEKCNEAKKKLEEGLINHYVYIELE